MEFMTDLSHNGLFVFPTHSAETKHNQMQLVKANEHAPVAQMQAVNKGPHAKNASNDKAGGLLANLYLCKGAKVMLTSNLSVKYGLFNGSVGIVEDIIYMNGKKPSEGLPDAVMVSFFKYTGPPFIREMPTIVPIVPVERLIDCYCHGCKRTQLPLRLGWGTTIHRCQGMTIGGGEPNRYIVIDPGTKTFESKTPGALFVALSRAKSAGDTIQKPDFAWHPEVLINEDRICHKVNTPTTKARTCEIDRIRKIASKTTERFSYLNKDSYFKSIILKLKR